MSRRKRRSSQRRWSSWSSKRSHSPFTYQEHKKILCDHTVCEIDMGKKGKEDSDRRESSVIESDEGNGKEPDISSKEERFRRNSYGGAFKNKKRSSISVAGDAERRANIVVTSVRVNRKKVSRIVFQQFRDSPRGDQVPGRVAVTTAKVKYAGQCMKVEIKETLHFDEPDIKATLAMQSKMGKRKKTSFTRRWDVPSIPNQDKIPQAYSSTQSSARSSPNEAYEKYKLSRVEVDGDLEKAEKDTASSNSNDDVICFKSCCSDQVCGCHPTLRGGIFSPYPLSKFCTQESDWSSANTTCSEVFVDIPPPHEFADIDCLSLEDVVQDLASCHISLNDTLPSQAEVIPALPESNYARHDLNSSRQSSAQDENSSIGSFLHQLSKMNTYAPLFMEPKMVVRSFNKHFVQNFKGKCFFRNNSLGILEAKSRVSYHVNKEFMRRKTFPGTDRFSATIQEHLPSHRKSLSSGLFPSFYMQSLQLDAKGSGQFDMEDESPFTFCSARWKSSESSTSHFGSENPSCSNSSFHRKTGNPHDPSQVFSDYEHDVQLSRMSNEKMVVLDVTSQDNPYKEESYQDKHGPGLEDQTEVTESGFDEEIVENEDISPEEPVLRDLLTHVTPSARSTSHDLLSEDGTILSKPPWLEDFKTCSLTKKSRGSVMTIITGGGEQRHLQNETKQVDLLESGVEQIKQVDLLESGVEQIKQVDLLESGVEQIKQVDLLESGVEQIKQVDLLESGVEQNIFSTVYEGPTVSPMQDIEDMEAESNSDAVHGIEASLLSTWPLTGTTTADQTTPEIHKVEARSGERIGTAAAAENRGLERSVSVPAEKDEMETLTEATGFISGPQVKFTTDNQSKMGETDSDEKHYSMTHTDRMVDIPEHLRPADPALKDAEEPPDRWVKRRRLFKESKQWSSAGGSSIASNMTQESVDSMETHSADINMADMEDRGFYTETFHSTAWMYCGDEVQAGECPGCLKDQTRPVTIRERTVKVSKGTGEYPWGFRIQFSKPIVVTEVDTNGAAEEAGLHVGDYVMSVNGTDVTSAPHSEAAALATRGPNLLTLTVGSDISRFPNTPRPTCRGYLHKRTQSGLLKGWRKRWFVLKHDCCLCYYRHKKDEGRSKAVSFAKLEGAEVGPDSSLGKPFVFKCRLPAGGRVYYFCATSNQEMKRWLEALKRAAQPVTQNHVWIDVTRRNASLPPLAIKNPECLGLLHQLDRNKDEWVKCYSILKDGCLYFYTGIRSTYALGGIFLHGYTVREQSLGSKRSTIELRTPWEEFKTFYLCAENATENKRWISALKASISKWLPLHQAIKGFMKCPPEKRKV